MEKSPSGYSTWNKIDSHIQIFLIILKDSCPAVCTLYEVPCPLFVSVAWIMMSKMSYYINRDITGYWSGQRSYWCLWHSDRTLGDHVTQLEKA